MIWLIHGNLGTPGDWEPVLQTGLIPAPVCSISLVDFFGTPVSLAEDGKKLGRFILEKDPSPILCAYSLGGRLALHALLEFPGRWKGAILPGAHTGLQEESEKAARREKDKNWANLLKHNPWDSFLNEWNSQPVFQGGKNIPRPDPTEKEVLFWSHAFEKWSTGDQKNLLPTLITTQEHTPCPLLFISGAEDAKFTTFYRSIIPQIACAHHAVIPYAGHRLLEDAPEELAAALQNFIHSL